MSSKLKILEKDVRKATIKHAKRRGIMNIRLSFGPGAYVGWPDDIFLIPGGKPLLIEFKAPGKEPTARQQLRIDMLLDLGYDVWVCDGIEAGKDILNNSISMSEEAL